MEPTEAAVAAQEIGEHAQHGLKKFENQVALVIAILAALLVINSVRGTANSQDILESQMKASDTWAFYQAKKIRSAETQLALDRMELELASQPPLPAETKALFAGKIAAYQADLEHFKSDPENGFEVLARKAKGFEEERDRAEAREPNFGFGEALFQLAIVVSSVSVITRVKPLLIAGIVLGALASALLANGFLLWVRLAG